jgi:very-short-patch-repair endonuclease
VDDAGRTVAGIGTLGGMPARRPVPKPLREVEAFRVGEARAAGVTPSQLRGRQYSNPFYGVHVVGAPIADDLRRLCGAARVVLPAGAVFSDETAAQLLGLPVRATKVLHVTVPDKGVAVRRRGMAGHVRHLSEFDISSVGGLPITTPERTFVDLAARLPVGELVAIGDAALRARLATVSSLAEAVGQHSGCRGIAKARRVLDHLNPRAESPRESMLRWLLIDGGLAVPEVNVNIYDSAGDFLARADLLFRKARVIVEYDGDQHRTDRAQFVKDVQRTTRLAAAGYLVLRFTGKDLVTRPQWVVATVRDALRVRTA